MVELKMFRYLLRNLLYISGIAKVFVRSGGGKIHPVRHETYSLKILLPLDKSWLLLIIRNQFRSNVFRLGAKYDNRVHFQMPPAFELLNFRKRIRGLQVTYLTKVSRK